MEHYCLESPSEIVVELEQLIYFETSLYNFDPLELGNKSFEL